MLRLAAPERVGGGGGGGGDGRRRRVQQRARQLGGEAVRRQRRVAPLHGRQPGHVLRGEVPRARRLQRVEPVPIRTVTSALRRLSKVPGALLRGTRAPVEYLSSRHFPFRSSHHYYIHSLFERFYDIHRVPEIRFTLVSTPGGARAPDKFLVIFLGLHYAARTLWSGGR